MVDDKNKKNKPPKDSDESRKWPPKSFMDFTKQPDEEKPKPLSEINKPEKSDKPSFMNLTGDLTGESFPWDKQEQAESQEEALPWQADEAAAGSEIGADYLKENEPPKIQDEKFAKEELSLSELFTTEKQEDDKHKTIEKEIKKIEEPVLAIDAGASGDDTDDFLSSLKEDPIDDDKNPYRAYAYYDFLQSELAEEPVKPGLKLNRQAVILIVAVLIAGAWFGYQKFTEGRYKFASQRERKRPERQKVIPRYEEAQEELPLWALTKQEIQKKGADREVILRALDNSGRVNPFAVPESVLKMIKQDIEKKIAEEKPPEIFKKTAYRATLTGVIKSSKGVLAIVGLRTANFEITEGTAKPKIIQEAIKAMTRVEDDSLEVISGDSVGPWTITEIDDGRQTGLEARMVIERNGEQKTLRIGVPVELGIYDEFGNLDIYKEVEEEFKKNNKAL